MHLPLAIKEIQAGYLSSSFFKDLCKYLAQNIMPHNRHTRHKVDALAEPFHSIGLFTVQIGNDTRQRKGTSCHSRKLYRQDY